MPNNYISAPRPLAEDYVFFAKFEGAEGSQNFTDLLGNTPVVHGNPKITRVIALEGISSLDLTAADTYLSYNAIAGLAFGGGDFCIEGRTRWTLAPDETTSRGVLQISTAVGGMSQTFDNIAINFRQSDLRWEIYAGGSNYISSAGPAINTNTHYVLERWNNVTTLYANGVAVLSISDSFNYMGTNMVLGNIYTPNHAGLSYHDDIKITRFARFKGAFTPPAP